MPNYGRTVSAPTTRRNPMSYNPQNSQRADGSGKLGFEEILQGVLNEAQDALKMDADGSTAPLPTGAATAAKQAAPGTAGTPSAEVTSVQGVTNGTPVNTSVDSYAASATFNRTADIATYSALDVVSTAAGAVMEFTNIGPAGGCILITFASLEIDIAAVPAGTGNYRVNLYDAAPTAIADNAAYNLPSGDRAKHVGFVEVTTPEDLGDTLYVKNDTVRLQVQLAAASTSLFGILETMNAITGAGTSSATHVIRLRSIRVE